MGSRVRQDGWVRCGVRPPVPCRGNHMPSRMFSARGVTGGLLRAALPASTAAIAAPATAGDIFVSDASQLSAAIGGAAPGDRIELQNDIALGTTLLPPVSANITIEGHGHTIDAQGNNRTFFLDSTATIQNVTLARTAATSFDKDCT